MFYSEATKEKRKQQQCKSFTLKIKPLKPGKVYLNRLFLEAKWLRNYALERLGQKEKIDTKSNIPF